MVQNDGRGKARSMSPKCNTVLRGAALPPLKKSVLATVPKRLETAVIMRGALIASALAGGAFPALAAPERPRLVDEVTACRDVPDAARRLACYDTAVGKLATATASKDIVVLDREEVRNTRRSLFGFALPKLPLFGGGGDDANKPDEVRELATTLKSFRPAGYGLWTLVLAEGGTWQTTEASRTLDPRSGQSIRVKSGPLGGYMANIDGGRAVRVRRIG